MLLSRLLLSWLLFGRLLRLLLRAEVGACGVRIYGHSVVHLLLDLRLLFVLLLGIAFGDKRSDEDA